METVHQADLQSIKEYRFALLPPKIEKADADKGKTEEAAERKFGVQCQLCGRLGVMSIQEMQQHYSRHQEESKAETKAEEKEEVLEEVITEDQEETREE